ncbi:hypothetical protein XocBAI20_01895 [Xanthomonas oryzae pv. oryzicola]|nr:hypothetical protein XocBAI20_01895 [Xanthomonas oryzae pv. oryzicola]
MPDVSSNLPSDRSGRVAEISAVPAYNPSLDTAQSSCEPVLSIPPQPAATRSRRRASTSAISIPPPRRAQAPRWFAGPAPSPQAAACCDPKLNPRGNT